MNRRKVIVSGSAMVLGPMLIGTRKSRGDAGEFSVRPTSGGPLITPNPELFVYSVKGNPSKTPSAMYIDGLVDSAARYSLDDLASIPLFKKLQTLECFSNKAHSSLIFTTSFEGVPLSALLDKAGVKPQARAALIETSDALPHFLLPLSELRRSGTMLVAKLGGEPVPLQHGSPYTRLFIPGAGGDHDCKWVTRITFVEDAAAEHQAPVVADFLAPSPREMVGSISGVRLTGYAFSGPDPVAKVELSTDNGQTYQPMPLRAPPDPNVWLTWDLTWRPPRAGPYLLRVKATSASGRTQDVPGDIAIAVR